jgi:dihydroorotase
MAVVLQGARVLDPGRGLDGVMDIRLEHGRIAALGRDLPTEGAAVHPLAGAVVTPGLVDGHVHCYEGVGMSGIDPDVIGVGSGVTTVVDAGSSGANTFAGLRRYVMARARTRVMALLNISLIGTPGGPNFNEVSRPEWIDEDATERVIEANRDVIVGIKVRASRTAAGATGVEPVRRACALAEHLSLPVMVHVGDPHSRENPIAIEDVVRILRPGDIVSHLFTGHPGGLLDDAGRVRPAVREAYASGLKLDVGHGMNNMSFETAARVLDQGIQPHTISTDVHRGVRQRIVYDLPTTLAKFLAIGFTLPQVVEKATYETARAFGRPDWVPGVAVGQPAELSAFRVEDAEWTAQDSMGREIRAHQRIVPLLAVRGEQVCEPVPASRP